MFGNNMKKLRKEKKLTQKQLAEICGISTSYLQQLELGQKENPSIEVFVKIAVALGVDVNELITGIKKTLSNKLITQTLDGEGVVFSDYNGSIPREGDHLEFISKTSGIDIDILKKCINENYELPLNEFVKLLEFSSKYDNPGFENFVYNHEKYLFEMSSKSDELKFILNKVNSSENYDPSEYSNEDIAINHLKTIIWYVSGKENLPSELVYTIFNEVCNTIKYELFKNKSINPIKNVPIKE